MITGRDLDAIVLDAGNTLVSIDFDRIAAALASHEVAVQPQALRRAEASVRPGMSEWLQTRGANKADDAFALYLEAIFLRLPLPRARERADALAPELLPPGESNRLWRWVIPGVREGLDRLHDLGFPLAVVSNSDGSVGKVLEELQLDTHLAIIVDSAVVGVEKPDPKVFAPALNHLKVPASRTLYVGDLYYPDVVGARAAGMIPLLLDPFDDWRDLDCDRVHDLPELADRLSPG